eukprot:365841-Chlamydomonas_euryale.AAC.5
MSACERSQPAAGLPAGCGCRRDAASTSLPVHRSAAGGFPGSEYTSGRGRRERGNMRRPATCAGLGSQLQVTSPAGEVEPREAVCAPPRASLPLRVRLPFVDGYPSPAGSCRWRPSLPSSAGPGLHRAPVRPIPLRPPLKASAAATHVDDSQHRSQYGRPPRRVLIWRPRPTSPYMSICISILYGEAHACAWAWRALAGQAFRLGMETLRGSFWLGHMHLDFTALKSDLCTWALQLQIGMHVHAPGLCLQAHAPGLCLQAHAPGLFMVTWYHTYMHDASMEKSRAVGSCMHIAPATGRSRDAAYVCAFVKEMACMSATIGQARPAVS